MTYLTKLVRVETRDGEHVGTTVCFCSTATGTEGYEEALRWIHQHTDFSWQEAITNQGYQLISVSVAVKQVWAKDRGPDGAPCPLPQERP